MNSIIHHIIFMWVLYKVYYALPIATNTSPMGYSGNEHAPPTADREFARLAEI